MCVDVPTEILGKFGVSLYSLKEYGKRYWRIVWMGSIGSAKEHFILFEHFVCWLQANKKNVRLRDHSDLVSVGEKDKMDR